MSEDVDREALLAEWLEETEFKRLKPDQITVRDYAEAAGVSMKSAKVHLDQLVYDERATVELVYDPRVKRRCMAYRLVE